MPLGCGGGICVSCGLQQPRPGVGYTGCNAGLFLHVDTVGVGRRGALDRETQGEDTESRCSSPCTAMYGAPFAFQANLPLSGHGPGISACKTFYALPLSKRPMWLNGGSGMAR